METRTKALIAVVILIVAAILALQGIKSSRSGANSDIMVKSQRESVAAKELKYPVAKELVSPDGYINTEPGLTIKDNIGKKVILVDFWTYSCINCQRTLPYLNSWEEKYADKGLLIIGVHTPEFAFEKEYNNVLAAVEKYGIKYPVVLDNEYRTWSAYQNRYWPRKYLIDIDGFIVYDHIGEGAYDETEKKIVELLDERSEALKLGQDVKLDSSKPEVPKTEFEKIRTPEIYFGYGFSRGQLGNTEGFSPDNTVEYKYPEEIGRSMFYLNGPWLNNNDNMESQGNASVLLAYSAKQVNIVAGSEEPVTLGIYLDGQQYSTVNVSGFDLYTVVPGQDYGEHVLEIEAPKGAMIYTFTFG